MTVDLHPVRGTNDWCGPSAVSALTGVRTEEAARRISQLTGRGLITSLSPPDIAKALGSYGLGMHRLSVFLEPHMRPWLGYLVLATRGQQHTYLAAVESRTSVGHWIAIRDGSLVCRVLFDGEPRRLGMREAHKIRARVIALWSISKIDKDYAL